MKQALVIMIPPSEGKTPGGEGPRLKPSRHANEMINRLQSYDGDWGKLLGVKGKALDEALAANQSLLQSPTMPAIERYSGVVYDGIGYSTLKAPAKRFFDAHVRIVSALLGLLAPQDPIPHYKLKIEKLDAAAFWKPIIAEELSEAFVIDLLPKAHQKAVEYSNGVAVDFIVEKNGKRKPAGHFGKHIKGRFVRWLCENKATGPESFSEFDEEGFKWTGDAFLKRE